MILDRLLEIVFEQLFALTSNYGMSIILLSLVVTLLMLPLFWYAEIIQNKEKRRKAAMQPALDKIKNIKNSQEKFYYTKEIYRKNNYKSYYSLTGLIGLVIQVPFFIAAYWMLKDYVALEGISFGPIADLFQPDAIITLGGVSINLLPLLMTFLNLIGIRLQYKYMDKSEAIQLTVIAFVFLILLYNLSAALVLYWTMNNLFALGKNHILSNKLGQLNEQNNGINLNTLGYYFKNIAIVLLSVFTVVLLLSAINMPWNGGSGTKSVLIRLSFSSVSCFFIFLFAIKKLKHFEIEKVTLLNIISASVVTSIVVILTGTLLLGGAYWGLAMSAAERHGSDIGIILNTIVLLSGSLLSIVGLILYFNHPVYSFYKKLLFPKIPVETTEDKKKLTLVVTSCLLLWVSVFTIIPVQIYLSVPEDFDFQPFPLLIPLAAQILLAFAAIWILIKFMAKKKTLIATILTILSFVLIIGFATPAPDWGLLKDFTFEDYTILPIPFAQSVIQIIGILLFSVIAFYFLYSRYLIQKFARPLSTLFICVMLGLIGQTTFLFIADMERLSSPPEKAENISPIRISKNKNTVIFFVDAFAGNAIPLLLEEYPDLKQKLDGFTFYADAISQGSWTWNGAPGILGGHEFTPMNHIDEQGNIHRESLVPAAEKFVADFANSFDELNFYGSHPYNTARISKNVKKYNLVKKDETIHQKDLRSKLFATSVFKAVPLMFKNLIYNEGHWRTVTGENFSSKHGGMGEIYYRYLTVNALANIESVDVDNNCSFIFTMLSHGPFHVNKNGKWNNSPASPYWNTEAGLNSSYHVLSKITDFIEKAKAMNIYKNMQIIIVADHGNMGIPKNLTNDKTGLLTDGKPINRKHFLWFDALLMVKQPDSTGGLYMNTNTFMSNADVPSIVQANLENKTEELFVNLRDDRRKLIHVSQYFGRQEQVHIEMNGTSLNTEHWRILRNDYKNSSNN